MRNTVLYSVSGLLGLAGLLPFAPVEWPAVLPMTAAIAGAVIILRSHSPRCRGLPPPQPAKEFPRIAKPADVHVVRISASRPQ
jgi:hypothetical protein